ncbi:MAG: UDP-N-acetylglucosamine 2-epimerase (non-hydrolyzing) [Bryobacterales bacterium]|nr:UDP-N-acetylglucosamine 2-epimerase (non-hydrolyzing) [Bryobacterales bacterium]
MRQLSVACVVGARPNFIKIGPILSELRSRPRFTASLIHTGQHYSPEMSASIFEDLGLPAPDLNLEVGGGSITTQTAEIMLRIERVFLERRPDLLLVVGDVNSTLAAALVAVRHRIPVAHVEAGLRSFDRTMPEEINRIVTDSLSDYLFASERAGIRNLLAEGVPEAKIFFTGNVMIDTLLGSRRRAACSDVVERLGLASRGYIVATLHRPSNVDSPETLAPLIGVLRQASRRMPVVFPAHPRTRQRMEAAGIRQDGLLLVPPLGYLDFLRLMDQARLMLTDSGGIQEETTILGVPCLTLRENTERPVTIEQGTNRLVGTDPATIGAAIEETLARDLPASNTPELWDGRAAARIADVLERVMA